VTCSRTSRCGGRWRSSAFPAQLSTAGTTGFALAGLRRLEDRSPWPGKVWNRIPDEVRDKVVTLALDEPDLSPRELAVRFTDAEKYFVAEASAYRILKAHSFVGKF
jgi:hypothetical protein